MLRKTMVLPAVGFAMLAAGTMPVAFAGEKAGEHAIHTNETIQWQPAKALPPGADMAVLAGNPAEDGPFALRLRFPSGYQVPPHWHSKFESVTVISGTFGLGTGETFDRAKTQTIPAGGFFSMPARMPHYAVSMEQTVVQINGVGPFDLNYVNPADDPRKQTGSSQ